MKVQVRSKFLKNSFIKENQLQVWEVSMKKLIPILLILTITISLFSGCTQQNGVKINYQTFYSGNINFSSEDEELLSQEEIDIIIQLGKDLAFEVEYPLDWQSEYNLDCCGEFSIRFYPENTDWRNSTYIRFERILMYPEPITKEKLKLEFFNTFTDFTEENIQLSNNIFIWQIIGKSPEVGPQRQNFSQAIAYILYNNVEVYHMVSYFSDSNSTNIQIFNHMARSFNK